MTRLFPWATALASWTLGVAAVSNRIGALPDWPRFWIASLAAGAVAGALIYLIGGWWYRTRLEFSGAVRPDRGLARRVYLFAGQAYALPYLFYLGWETMTYDTPRAAAAGDDPGAALIVACLFASIVISYLAARSRFELRPWPARVWFLLLPVLVYALALLGAIATVYLSQVGGFAMPNTAQAPTRIERAGFSLELPGGWIVDTSDPEYDPDRDFTVEPADLDAAVRFVIYDESVDPRETVEATRRDLSAAFDATLAGIVPRWGAWEGSGVRLEASLQVRRYDIMIFCGTSDHAAFEVVELVETSTLDAVRPALERMRASFELN